MLNEVRKFSNWNSWTYADDRNSFIAIDSAIRRFELLQSNAFIIGLF